jgi:hypothetical protein
MGPHRSARRLLAGAVATLSIPSVGACLDGSVNPPPNVATPGTYRLPPAYRDRDPASGPAPGGPDANAAVARAEQWVGAKLRYCQAPNHGHDRDSFCPSTCSRQDNSLWDPYRTDCAGLLSWAWELPPPGRTTLGFAPFKSDISVVIDAMDLQPGDALNSETHSLLFKQWLAPGRSAVFIDEPGCDSPTPYAREFTSDVRIAACTVKLRGRVPFTAIRHLR